MPNAEDSKSMNWLRQLLLRSAGFRGKRTGPCPSTNAGAAALDGCRHHWWRYFVTLVLDFRRLWGCALRPSRPLPGSMSF